MQEDTDNEVSLVGTSALASMYGEMPFHGDAAHDERARSKLVKSIVSMVRRCPEYSRYRTFLIENMDMGRCSVLTGLDAEESITAGLEVHHAPLSLYDVTELVLGQMEVDGERVTTFAVANRVMANHWKGKVGLVSLSQTVHEAVHAGQVYVDPRTIFGDWQGLLDENKAGITEHLAEKLRAVCASWGTGDGPELNARALGVSVQRWADSPASLPVLLGRGGES